MRTKLDEIVEEEYRALYEGKWLDSNRPLLLRIAERAFREGLAAYHKTAEWARKNLYENGRYDVIDYTKIQPEPVGERQIAAPHCPAQCGGPHSLRASDGMYHCNTRKGQRRKETLIARLCSLNIYRSLTDNNVWDWDRRSGKDRRK